MVDQPPGLKTPSRPFPLRTEPYPRTQMLEHLLSPQDAMEKAEEHKKADPAPDDLQPEAHGQATAEPPHENDDARREREEREERELNEEIEREEAAKRDAVEHAQAHEDGHEPGDAA